jgi:protein phosphatase
VEIGGPIALHHADTVLLCSDGLWAGLTDRELAQAFSNTTVMRAVPALMDRALEVGGADADNCTALAMTWAGSESLDMVPPTDSPVSTLAVPAGTVASTLQMAALDELDVDGGLTDEQIDRAVREIRRAIRRSTKLVDGES